MGAMMSFVDPSGVARHVSAISVAAAVWWATPCPVVAVLSAAAKADERMAAPKGSSARAYWPMKKFATSHSSG
jgi:hypothetical protein